MQDKALIEKAILLHDKTQVLAKGDNPIELSIVADLDHLWSFTHQVS